MLHFRVEVKTRTIPLLLMQCAAPPTLSITVTDCNVRPPACATSNMLFCVFRTMVIVFDETIEIKEVIDGKGEPIKIEPDTVNLMVSVPVPAPQVSRGWCVME